jgi:hypothetical protein
MDFEWGVLFGAAASNSHFDICSRGRLERLGGSMAT